MKQIQEDIVREEGKLMLLPDASTYTVARVSGFSQAQVWRHVSHHLRSIDHSLWIEVQVVLKRNTKRPRI